MNSPTQAPSLAGHVLGGAGDSMAIAEWQDAGGAGDGPRYIAPLHVHHNDDEVWYVLQGTLCVRLGDEEVEARAGSAVIARRGTPHTFWNPAPDPVRYLLVMTPRIYALIAAIHAMKERTPALMQEVFREHDSELL